MASKTYFVTLTPHQLFFFGGEQGQTADYFVKGNFLPQQTALLGLVRHQILLQNGLMQNNRIIDDGEASGWIGPSSFEYNNNNSFGVIKSISPCYLVNSNGRTDKVKFLPFHQPYCKNLKWLGGNFLLPDYDPKNDYPDQWLSTDKNQNVSNAYDSIYQEVIKPGVDKNYSGKTEDDDHAYYKQVWFKMNNGFSFGFYAEIAPEAIFSSAEVNFGKESSPFFMEVSEAEKVDDFIDEESPTALVLTSDTYTDDDILRMCDFAVTDTVPFRNIINITTKENPYYKLNNPLNMKSTVRLQLFKRGSVFFADAGNIKKIKDAIDKQSGFKTIGYNHFHLLNIS